MNYNFIKQVNSQKLEKEILATKLATLYSHILTTSSPLLATIVFTNELSPENLAILENLIAAHTTGPTAVEHIQQVIKNAIEFGNNLVIEFATENILLGITQAGKTGEVLDKLSGVMVAVQAGSLYEALGRIRNIPVEDYDTVFITAPRLLAFLNKIEAYLGLPLSESL